MKMILPLLSPSVNGPDIIRSLRETKEGGEKKWLNADKNYLYNTLTIEEGCLVRTSLALLMVLYAAISPKSQHENKHTSSLPSGDFLLALQFL